MRISLWQQFSSNHSASYWVIGTFKTVDEAQHAYREMRGILEKLEQAMRENPSTYTETEQAIAKQYQIEWTSSIDWWPDYDWLRRKKPEQENTEGQHRIVAALSNVGNLVMASPPWDTRMSWQPFKALIGHFGAELSGYDFYETEIFLKSHTIKPEFRFTAPDKTTADALETAINTYLAGPHVSETNPPPWHDDEANFQAILGKSQYLDSEAVAAIQQAWQDSYNIGINTPSLQRAREIKLSKRLTVDSSPTSPPRLERDGLDFKFINLWFSNTELASAALIAYLEVKGCTNIHLGYHYVPIEEKKGGKD